MDYSKLLRSYVLLYTYCFTLGMYVYTRVPWNMCICYHSLCYWYLNFFISTSQNFIPLSISSFVSLWKWQVLIAMCWFHLYSCTLGLITFNTYDNSTFRRWFKSTDQYHTYWMTRGCFTNIWPKFISFLSCSHIQGMAINWSCDVPSNVHYMLLSPISMDKMIIMITIKCKPCSWRNFHLDVQCVTLNFYYNKSSCSCFFFLFAYMQKTCLFSQIKKFCRNEA